MDLGGYISVELFIVITGAICVIGFIAYRSYSIHKETKNNPLIKFAEATARNNARNQQIVAIHSNDGRVIMHEVDMSTWSGNNSSQNDIIPSFVFNNTQRFGGTSEMIHYTDSSFGDHAENENNISADEHAQQLGISHIYPDAAIEPQPKGEVEIKKQTVVKSRFETIIE
jgi:hypothetical protein